MIHEFELATTIEKVWSAPVFDPVALDAPPGSLETARHGPRGLEGFPRLGPAPTPSAMSKPVRHAISPSIEPGVMKNQRWNPLAAQCTSRLTIALLNLLMQVKTKVGWKIDPLEYCQFIHNFDVNIASLINDLPRRLAYLIQYCRGEAKQVIENCCTYEPECSYKKAMEILYHQFGRPHIVAQAHINQLITVQMINPTGGSALQKLARQMLKCDITLSQTGCDSDLNNSETLLKIMDCLPPCLQTKWAERAENIFGDGGLPRFSDLTAFIQQSADIASNMLSQRLSTNSSRDRSGSRPQQTSKNDNLCRGTTLAVRSVSALESRHESPREIRDTIVDCPRDGSHGDSSRVAHRDVTTDKCISLGARYVPRSYPPP